MFFIHQDYSTVTAWFSPLLIFFLTFGFSDYAVPALSIFFSKHLWHTVSILLPVFHNRLKIYFKYLISKTFAVYMQYASFVELYCVTKYTFSIMKMTVY